MTTYPYNFVGPLRHGDKRGPAPVQGPVRPGDDEESFRYPSGRDGSGSSSKASSKASAAQAAAKASALKKIAERTARDTKKLRQQKAQEKARKQAEQKKIIFARSRIIARGGREIVRASRDARSGDRLRITTWKKGGNTVKKVENITKGYVTYNQYAPGRGGGSVRRVGSVTIRSQKTQPKPVTATLSKNSVKKISVTIPKDVLKKIKNVDTSAALRNIQSTAQLNTSIKNDIKLGKVSSLLVYVADVVTGGSFTEKRIEKDQATLNNRIIKFNDKYNGKELSESQFNKAQSEQKFIESEQNKINNRIDNLVSSKKNKFRNFYNSLSIQSTSRLTVQQQADVIRQRNEDVKIQAQIKRNQPTINKKNQKIKEKKQEVSRVQNKINRTLFDEIKLFRLKNQINTLQTDVARLRFELPPKILAGTMPIIPASVIPSGISQVRFTGTKVRSGGKIVTDIVFKTQKGIMGIARGVSTTVKGNTVSIVGGRFGKITASLMKGGRKFTKIRTFVGVEKSVVRGVKFTSEKIKQIAKFIQKQKSGVVRIIKTNIQGMQQAGIGRVVTIKGSRFFKPFIRFPSGRLGAKLGRGIDLDDFASISAILTKGDISAILGKTITAKGRRAEFIGLIKSLASGSSSVALTSIDKQQYSKALQKLFTTIAAAVSRAERTGRFTTKALVLAGAAASLSRTVPTVSSIKSAKTTLVRKKIISSRSSVTTRPKSVSIKRKSLAVVQKRKILVKQKQIQRQINKQKTKVRQLSRSKSKKAQKKVSRAKQLQKQYQRQLSKTKQRQKLVQKQMLRSPTGPKPIIPRIMPRIIVPPLWKLPKGFKKKSLSKKVPTYYVVEKVRSKFKKLYPKPLTAKDAKDYAVYSIDNNLSKTAFFIPLGKAKTVVRPPKQVQGYASRNSRKVRPYRIKYGRKRQLVNGFIEKRRYFQDTRGEKSQLKTLQRKARARKKLTPTQRKVMLRNLARARRSRTGSRPVKRRVVRRTPVRRTTIKRKMSPQRRRQLIKQLKRARAARMRNIRKNK